MNKFFSILFVLSIFLFSCSSKKETSFLELKSAETHVEFENKLLEKPLFNILYYLYYYNGAGVATGDINNDGLVDIYFAANNTAANKLYLNKGNFQFEDITTKAGVAGNADWCTGVTMTDINGDGFLDIYVCAIGGKYGLNGSNQLFINNKNGTFTESATKYGLDFKGLSTQSVFFDYDHDGDLDCFILNQSHHPHANIVDTSNRRKFDSVSGDRLFRNDIVTTGKFTDVSPQAGIYQSVLGYGLGISVADLNNDGWEDIYVGNDFHENDYYYVNNGNGTFTESGAKSFKHYSRFSMGNDIADYDNDGQPDVITVDMLPEKEKILKTYGSDENPEIYKLKIDYKGYQKQYSKNCLQHNNGGGESFSETSLLSNMSATDWSWSPLFADFDNDGFKDLFISSGIVKRPVDMDYIKFVSDLDVNKGRQKTDLYDEQAIKDMPEGSSHPYFYKGNGTMNFKDVSELWGTSNMKGFYTGSSYADLNNDGRLDVVINCVNAKAVILKNNTPDKISLDIELKGEGDNKLGIGTKVWLYSGGKMQYQQMMLTRGFQSSVEPRLHFGLDSIRNIDSILVVWPNQKYQKIKTIPAKGLIQIKQIEAGGKFEYKQFFPKKQEAFNEVNVVGLNYLHKENEFSDFNKQYLIPHKQSTRGPKVAVADVNNDGLEDIYVCGASGQAGQLLVQNSSGSFNNTDATVFANAIASEDVDAIFFDANKDGFADLYVVSGGNQFDDGNPLLADHLYMNDGKGHFKLAEPNQLPSILKNKSCVTASDIDHDGDLDLFVGGLADAKKFGIAQPSYMLLNDGKGNFKLATSSTIQIDNLGIVTTASFADINKDGWDDLIVAGEWMPIKIYINNKGIFKEQDLDASFGLWQTVKLTDVNGDGLLDILAGNWGLNNKLVSGKNGPAKLYVKDFDGNGSVEQIMCYTIDGKEYTFYAKDELERPLPVLKKGYLKYSEVAGKTVQFMFDDLFKDYTELKAEELASCCFLNNGKGGFTKVVLPTQLQLAPLFAFNTTFINNKTCFIGAGNFYGVTPYEGRYDAQQPTIFSFNSAAQNFEVVSTMKVNVGEVRDIKWINSVNRKQFLILTQNNDRLIFMEQTIK